MKEIASKLRSVYLPGESGSVTPTRIKNYLENPVHVTGESLFNEMDEISDKFFSKKNRPKTDKIKRFIRDLDELLDHGAAVSDLKKISPECINKNGSINLEEFEKLLKNS